MNDSKLVDVVRLSQSQSSITIKRNQYQQTTPSIEASLRAGLAIGAKSSKKHDGHDVIFDDAQVNNNSPDNETILERKTRRVKSPEARKKEIIASPQTIDVSQVDFRGIIYNDESAEEEANKTIINETITKRNSRSARKMSSPEKPATRRLERKLAKELDNTQHMEDEEDLSKTYTISETQENNDSKAAQRHQKHRKAATTPKTSTPHNSHKNNQSRQEAEDDEAEMKLDDTIPVDSMMSGSEDESEGSLRNALRNMFVCPDSAKSRRGKRSMRAESKSREREEYKSTGTGRVEKRRRAMTQNQMETALQINDTDVGFIARPQPANSQQIERILDLSMRVGLDHNNDDEEMVIDNSQAHHSIRRQQKQPKNPHPKQHPKTNKEKELEEVDEELRKSLRPHIPPPRRSERLRMKRAKRLQEKRLALLDQIEADKNYHKPVFNVNMRHITMRRKPREA